MNKLAMAPHVQVGLEFMIEAAGLYQVSLVASLVQLPFPIKKKVWSPNIKYLYCVTENRSDYVVGN